MALWQSRYGLLGGFGKSGLLCAVPGLAVHGGSQSTTQSVGCRSLAASRLAGHRDGYGFGLTGATLDAKRQCHADLGLFVSMWFSL